MKVVQAMMDVKDRALALDWDTAMAAFHSQWEYSVALAQYLAHDPDAQHVVLMLCAGLGLGLLLVVLNAAFPSKTIGPDFSTVLERGVLTEKEFAELSQKRQAEQDESFAAVRRAMLGTKHAAKHTNKQQGAAGSPKSSEGELVEHVDGDVAHQVSHSATSNLRRRRGRGKQAKAKQGQSTSNHNSSDDVAAADGAIAKPQDAQESGAETDEEDMNLDMTEDQRAMQKALLGTRDTRKIASMLDEAEQKVRSGTPLKSHRSMSRSFDCIVYLLLCGLLLYALQVEYGMNLPQWLGYLFPTEAAVFEGQPAQVPPIDLEKYRG